MAFESPQDKIDTNIQYGGQSWRNSCDEKIDINDEHLQLVRVRTNHPQIDKEDNSTQEDDNVNEVDSLSKEAFFLLCLVPDSPQKFATKSVEISLSNEAHNFIYGINFLISH